MTLPVRFLPEARQDALDTCAWYEDRQSGLGALFGKSLAAPRSYPHVMGAVRRVTLQRFPYAVYTAGRSGPDNLESSRMPHRQEARSCSRAVSIWSWLRPSLAGMGA